MFSLSNVLTEREVSYPFMPSSRQVIEKISFEEILASKEIQSHAELRLLASLGKTSYNRHVSQLVEFLSFFVAALVASQDDRLVTRFSLFEAKRAKENFRAEPEDSKLSILSNQYGIEIKKEINDLFTVSFENYLLCAEKYALFRFERWKLGRQNLSKGLIYLNENKIIELFADCSNSLTAEGIRNLRRSAFPDLLKGLRDKVLAYMPSRKEFEKGKFAYVEKLLRYPVTDGRHRLVWLVLAPYLVNVKRIDENQAIDIIMDYVSYAGEARNMRRFVEYNVRRARRNGLLPPTISTLKNEHPDLYFLLPQEVKENER